jgi:ribosome recycling factor
MLDGLYNETNEHMERCVASLQQQLGGLRTGKASPRLLDGVKVEAYGTKMPLNQLATLGAPEPRLLTVQPFDKSQIGAIEKAIQAANLGITPANDGNMIRLPVPPLNEERRREYVKLARKHGEDAKVAARGARRDANERMKKAKEAGDITEDDLHRGHDRVQKLTDATVARIDKVLAAKEAEIMEV